MSDLAAEVPEPTAPPPVPAPPIPPENERRIASFDEIEVRADGDKIVLNGHAAVFDRLSDDLGGFRERIQRGAFRKALDKATLDVRLLHNHDQNWSLARSTINSGPGMLDLSEDPKGLRVYAELVPTQQAKDLRLMVDYGVISQMSFGFRIGPDGSDSWDETSDGLIRTIRSFGEIFDVSTVTYPAYPQTDAAMRQRVCGIHLYRDDGEVDGAAVRALAIRLHLGDAEASAGELAAVDAACAKAGTVSPWVAERALRAVSSEPELRQAVHGKSAAEAQADAPSGQFRLAAMQRRLRLIELSTGGQTR